MNSRRWVLSFLAILFVGIGAYMALNYYANPLGYFTTTKGLDYYWTDDYSRSLKARWLLAHEGEYNAAIVGGSKSGALDPDQLGQYTGKNYYNYYMNIGNFSDYLRYSKFLIEETGIEELTLHLSSYDVLYYDRTGVGNAYKVPAVLSGSPWENLKEFLSYLMTDVSTLADTLKERSRVRDDKAEPLETGKRDRIWENKQIAADPDAYAAKFVTNVFDRSMKRWAKTGVLNTSQAEFRAQNLEALREIKSLCDEHGVTLKVVIGPSFISERFYYECTEYYDYLRQVVNIVGEVWDFSGFCPENFNPYNFYNDRHYNFAMADLMVDTMYGHPDESRPEFGVLLTDENIQAYLKQRSADFQSVLSDYESGALTKETLPGLDDPSYVSMDKYR